VQVVGSSPTPGSDSRSDFLAWIACALDDSEIHQSRDVVCFDRSAMRDGLERPLTVRERAVIDFERECFTMPGGKDANILRVLGISPSTYRRTLRMAVERRAAFAYDPLTVARVRRQREDRRRERLVGRRADRP
jgi:hypothetical protein